MIAEIKAPPALRAPVTVIGSMDAIGVFDAATTIRAVAGLVSSKSYVTSTKFNAPRFTVAYWKQRQCLFCVAADSIYASAYSAHGVS